MKNLFWFTNDDGDSILSDFYGTEKEAMEYAQKEADRLGQDVYINCGEDMIDVAFC